MNWKLRKLFELVKNKGMKLQEVYALIPGSQEVYERNIRKALKATPPAEFGAHSYSDLTACLGPVPDKIVVEVSKSDGHCYFEVDVSVDEAGMISFGTAKEVEYKLVSKAKNESHLFYESLDQVKPENRRYDEQHAANLRLNESGETAYLSVDFAGQADVRNHNGRIYTLECLQEAVEELQDRLPLPFGTVHEDQTDLGKVAGLIHEVVFDAETGKVSIPKIELLDTTSGNDLKELLDKEIAIEVSHRAVGQGYIDKDESTGQETEIVTWLRYEGIDTVWPGRSGFGNTHLQRKPESRQGNAGGDAPVANPSANLPAMTSEEIAKLVAKTVTETVQGTLTPYQAQLQEQLTAQREQQSKFLLKSLSAEVIEEILLDYPQFGDVEKDSLRAIVADTDKLYERVSSNPTDRASVKAAQQRMIEGTVEMISKVRAQYGLSAKQLPEGRSGSRYINRYGGVTNVDEVISNSPLDITETTRIVNTAVDAVFQGNPVLKEQSERNQKHPNFQVHAEMLDREMHRLAPQIQSELDQGLKWETLQSGVAVPVSITSLYIELVAWKMLTAIPHVQLHPMVSLLENIPIEGFTSAYGRKAGLDKWAQASGVGEHTSIPTSKIDFGNHVLAASAQKYATTYTQEALATIRNTVMDIQTSVVALCGKDLSDMIDGMLWELQVNEALAGDSTKVSTAEALTAVGTAATATEWKAKKAGWVTYEWLVIKDSHNPTRSYPQRLFPDFGEHTQGASGITRQAMKLTDAQSADYEYARRDDGTIDESKHWYFDAVDGVVTLTAAGRTLLDSDTTDALTLTYQYSNNFTAWNATLPTGMAFKDHLWDLRFAISAARQKVIDQNYTPHTIAWSFAAEDQIAGGENFRRDGLTQTDVVDAQNTVRDFAGTMPTWSANFPKKFVLIFEDKFALYGIHTPYMMGPPQMIDETGDPFLSGNQFAGAAIPKWQKASVVGLQNFQYLD